MDEVAGERVTTVIRREPLLEKTCPVCQQQFLGLGRQRYCSVGCANRASYRRHADKRCAERRERYRVDKQRVSETRD